VSRDDDWTGWCRFFLDALRVQAESNHRKAEEILNLYEELKPRVRQLTHSQYSVNALDWIFERPTFKSSDFVKSAGIPLTTAKRILALLQKEQILKTIIPGAGARAAILAFPALLNAAEGDGAF
jgi:Fic family protein